MVNVMSCYTVITCLYDDMVTVFIDQQLVTGREALFPFSLSFFPFLVLSFFLSLSVSLSFYLSRCLFMFHNTFCFFFPGKRWNLFSIKYLFPVSSSLSSPLLSLFLLSLPSAAQSSVGKFCVS